MSAPAAREWVPRSESAWSVSSLGPVSPCSGCPRTLTSLSYRTHVESRLSSTEIDKTTWDEAASSGCFSQNLWVGSAGLRPGKTSFLQAGWIPASARKKGVQILLGGVTGTREQGKTPWLSEPPVSIGKM